MYVAYSHVIDWVCDDNTVSQEEALQILPTASRSLVLETLRQGEPYKLSFGFSNDEGLFKADFTPRRGHPLAREYHRWKVLGVTPDDAIAGAKHLWERLRKKHEEAS